MPNQIHHGGYPIGSVDYVPKSFKRRGAFIRYIAAGSVIWLLKPDIDAHYAQLDRNDDRWKPERARRNLHSRPGKASRVSSGPES